MRRPLVRGLAVVRRSARDLRAQRPEFLPQLRELLAQPEHGFVLLRHMTLQVRVAFLEQGQSFVVVHVGRPAPRRLGEGGAAVE